MANSCLCFVYIVYVPTIQSWNPRARNGSISRSIILASQSNIDKLPKRRHQHACMPNVINVKIKCLQIIQEEVQTCLHVQCDQCHNQMLAKGTDHDPKNETKKQEIRMPRQPILVSHKKRYFKSIIIPQVRSLCVNHAAISKAEDDRRISLIILTIS